MYRSGRQSEALRAIAKASRVLRDELGVEPRPRLQDLEGAILRHDPAIDASVLAIASSTAPIVVAPPATYPRATTQVESVRLVGRDSELAVLIEAYEESRVASRFVVIEGEPGIGKTRLAEELRAISDERGALAVWGRSDEGGAAPALWPWLAPLHTMANCLADVPESIAELLHGDALVEAGTAEAQMQFARFVAVVELINSVASTTHVVVLLDDLQWADTTSLELLSFLAGRLNAALVVATVRRLEVGRSNVVTDTLATLARSTGSRRVQLHGLDKSDTDELFAKRRVTARNQRDAAKIHDRSEGNPFFAIELARLLAEEGDPHAEVPGSISDVIRRRVSRLPSRAIELLGIAAVVGQRRRPRRSRPRRRLHARRDPR